MINLNINKINYFIIINNINNNKYINNIKKCVQFFSSNPNDKYKFFMGFNRDEKLKT